MRDRIINYLKCHNKALNACWSVLQITLSGVSVFVPKKKRIAITSFAGRNFDDSPKALYEEICKRKEFDDWEIVWIFVDPEKIDIPRGRKVKIDSIPFFFTLMSSKVWISNTGMDRDIHIYQPKTVKIETWHGTPLKKIGIDQNNAPVGRSAKRIDSDTIRCAQSEYDREIFQRVFNATKESFLLSDLPRNDELRFSTKEKQQKIRKDLGIPDDKKVILYVPTYREYDLDEENNYYLAPPIDIEKWKKEIGDEYVMLVRAHYAVNAALGIKDDEFTRDVTYYPSLNDLYIASDILMSDYSSAFVDYSILSRPMVCFAYDFEKYKTERGLYIDFHTEMPCDVLQTEDEVLNHIKTIDYNTESQKTIAFRNKYAPYRGNASCAVVDALINKLGI